MCSFKGTLADYRLCHADEASECGEGSGGVVSVHLESASIFYGLCICPVLQVRIDASKLNPDAHAIKSMILCHRRCLSNMSLCTSPLICGLDMTRTKLA